MSGDRVKGRRRSRPEFRPTLDGRLEPRFLLTNVGSHNQRAAQHSGGRLLGGFYLQTGFGGQLVEITTPDGGIFNVSTLNVNGISAGAGSVRARPVPRDPQHRVDLFVYNSTDSTVLTIDPQRQIFNLHDAHQFNSLTANSSPFLNIRNINLINRHGQTQIGQVLGYHSATFSGTLNVTSPAPVDRIAFEAIGPGARITTGGDVNTLDVAQNVSLGPGDYLHVGRDLNATQINGNINIGAGAQFVIGRDFAATVQPAKGSEPAFPISQATNSGGLVTSTTLFTSGVIGGNISIDPAGLFEIGRRPDNVLQIHGAFVGVNVDTPNLSINGVQGVQGLIPFVTPTGTSIANIPPAFIQLYGGAPPIIAPQPPAVAQTFASGPTVGAPTGPTTGPPTGTTPGTTSTPTTTTGTF